MYRIFRVIFCYSFTIITPMTTILETVLGAWGPLASILPDFKPRAAQQQMAARIEQALSARATLLVEAGTGTGKTYAYLVPALLSGLRILISTGTRTLQDQLFHRDLPRLAAALGRPARVALLKGRSKLSVPPAIGRRRQAGTVAARSRRLAAERGAGVVASHAARGLERTGAPAGGSHPLRAQLRPFDSANAAPAAAARSTPVATCSPHGAGRSRRISSW